MEKPYHALDLPEAVKSLPIRSAVDSNIVPPSDKGVYAVADLMKLAPTNLQHKYKSLLTPKMTTKEGECEKKSAQVDATQVENAEAETVATTDRNDQAADLGAGSTTDKNGEASKTTAELKIVEDGIGREVTADSGTADDQRPTGGGDQEVGAVAVAEGGEGAQKKKKKRKGAKNPDGTKKPKAPKATGFEEFYAEGPIAPNVYEDEVNNIYHHTLQFSERIESAIVRYKEKRKLNSKRGDMLNKYLALGGIDTSIKQFQGADHEKNDNDDSDDEFGPDYDGPTISNVSGNVKPSSSVFDNTQGAVTKYYNPFAPQNWRVDWQGCARAYLSIRAPYLFGIDDEEAIDAYCEVVINFCNYVLLHSVCPEYTDDILQTQKIARLAKKELRKLYTLGDTFPGPLHRALSCLTHGNQRSLYLFSEEEAAEKMTMAHDEFEGFTEDKCFTIAKCKSVIQAAISILGTPEEIKLLAELKEGDDIKVVKAETSSLEVVGIQLPTEEQKKEFEAMQLESGPVKPMGFIHVKPWSSPLNPDNFAPEDLTHSEARAKARREAKAEKARLDRIAKGIPEPPVDNTPTESFIISSHILEHVFMGMKFEGMIKEVAGGLRFIDEIKNLFPSYYETIENLKMETWREPKKTDRIPPTCDDAEAEAQDGEVNIADD